MGAPVGGVMSCGHMVGQLPGQTPPLMPQVTQPYSGVAGASAPTLAPAPAASPVQAPAKPPKRAKKKSTKSTQKKAPAKKTSKKSSTASKKAKPTQKAAVPTQTAGGGAVALSPDLGARIDSLVSALRELITTTQASNNAAPANPGAVLGGGSNSAAIPEGYFAVGGPNTNPYAVGIARNA